MTNYNYVMLFLFAIFIASCSQVMLKKSACKVYGNIIQEYLNPLVLSAYFIILIANLLAVIAYKGIELKYAPVLESTTYIFVLVLGIIFFNERFTRTKLIGVILIIIGVGVFQL